MIGSYDDAPGQLGLLSQYRNLLHHYTHQNSSEQAATFWGACGAMRRQIFVKLGGFDESLRYLEDVDLGLRLHKAGYKIRLARDWQIKHWKGYDPRSLIHTEIIQRALPWTRLALSGHGLINDLNTKTSNRVSVVLSLIMPLLGAAGFVTPWAWLVALAALFFFFLLNRGFFVFLKNKRGSLFAFVAMFWCWVHFVAGGVGFAYGLAEHGLKRLKANLPHGSHC